MFNYKHVTRVLDLIDAEIMRIETGSRKYSTSTIVTNPSDEGLPSFMAQKSVFSLNDEERVQKEIEFLNEIKSMFTQELDKISFQFGTTKNSTGEVKFGI